MYKVLLAEDEFWVRDSMQRNIHWEKSGFQLVAVCTNGQEAIDAVGRTLPDVVITDICMPEIDGIELAEFLHRHYPSITVVILTGFSEFSYAQKALRLHVHDFILKPIVPREFDEMLRKLMETLQMRQEQQNSLRRLEHRANHADLAMRNTFFQVLQSTAMTEEEVLMAAKKADVRLNQACHAILFCQLQYPPRGLPAMERLMNLTIGWTQRFPACVFGQTRTDNWVFLLGGATSGVTATGARELAEILLGELQNASGTRVRIGISSCCTRLENLHHCLLEAEYVLGYGFTTQQSILTGSHGRQCALQRETVDTLPGARQLVAMLQHEKSVERAQKLIDTVLDGMRQHQLHEDFCCTRLRELYQSMVNLLPPSLRNAAPDFPEGACWYEMEQLRAVLMDTVSYTAQYLMSTDNNPAERCVELAKQYIAEHYSDSELSLSDVLEQVGASKSYFSSVFKLKTEQTFVEYLTNIRIERAKALLRQTSLRTYEIADQTGFSDPHYFSVIFKRYTGQTPREFREKALP